MKKTEAQKRVNQLKAIEDGIDTLVALAGKAEEIPLLTKLVEAKIEANKSRLSLESYFNVEASRVIPFKPRGKK